MEGRGARGDAGNGTAAAKRVACITISPRVAPIRRFSGASVSRGARYQRWPQFDADGRVFALGYKSAAVETLRAPIDA
jgi:hypothetical protein